MPFLPGTRVRTSGGFLCPYPIPTCLVPHRGVEGSDKWPPWRLLTCLLPYLPPKEQQEPCCQGTQPLQKMPVLCEQGQTRRQQSARHQEEAGPHGERQAVWGVTQLQA